MENTDREKYIRVTSVLYPFSGLEAIDPAIVANAGRRGTKVHKICEAIIEGLGELGVDEESAPYVESFKSWWHLGHEVVCMERRFWSDDLQITGQVDLIVNTPDGLAVVDFKTSSKPSKTWPAQGSAYAILAKNEGLEIKKIYFLHLLKTGKPAKIYEYPVDPDLFLSVLRTWNHFYNREKQ